MPMGCEIESPCVHELDVALQKVTRLLQRAEADMNVGLARIDDQKTFEADLKSLLETLQEYTDCRIQQMRLSEPPLTDIRFETRIYNVRTDWLDVSTMIGRLIQDVQALHQIVDPKFDTAAVMCLIKAETVLERAREIIAAGNPPIEELFAAAFVTDWN
ncbi:hypothetical protein HY522_09380 [bacterium]|nr:hypothetical protein [bacterium]